MRPARDRQSVTITRAEYDELLAHRALVERLAPVCSAAADGDLEARVEHLGTDTEACATVVLATNHLLDQLDAFVRESAGALQAASAGRFHRRVLLRGLQGAFRGAAARINDGTARMASQASDLTASEQQRLRERRDADLKLLKNIVSVSISTIEMSVGSANIARETRSAQLAGATMASAVDELAVSIKEIESAARGSADAAKTSQSLVDRGQQLLGNLRTHATSTSGDFDVVFAQTQRLQTSVASLANVVEVISKIAEQTNLLALNATIEAAHAGELGKGFAVVAGEVKSLSRQTRAATDTIRDQIAALHEAFREMYSTVDHARTNVDDVSQCVASLGEGFRELDQSATSMTQRVDALASILAQQREAVDSLARNMASLKANGDRTMASAVALDEQAEKNLALVEGWRSEQSTSDVPFRDAWLAKADHMLWKKAVIDFAAGRRTRVDELSSPTECRLGRWLAQQPADLPWVAALLPPHRAVHEHGKEAARAFLAREPDEGFAHYHALEEASTRLVSMLDELLAVGDAAP
jgi:methyl-accepting chemotaxis protein